MMSVILVNRVIETLNGFVSKMQSTSSRIFRLATSDLTNHVYYSFQMGYLLFYQSPTAEVLGL